MFRHASFDNHEQVVHAANPETGLYAILAIHNTNRGPALGGCRVWAYESDEEALIDALRLSRGMTYKAALADLPLGGGKTVMRVERRGAKTPAMFESPGTLIAEPRTSANNYRDSGAGCWASRTSRSSVPG